MDIEHLKSIVDQLLEKGLSEEAVELASIINEKTPIRTIVKAEHMDAIQILKKVENDISEIEDDKLKRLGARVSIARNSLTKLL